MQPKRTWSWKSFRGAMNVLGSGIESYPCDRLATVLSLNAPNGLGEIAAANGLPLYELPGYITYQLVSGGNTQ